MNQAQHSTTTSTSFRQGFWLSRKLYALLLVAGTLQFATGCDSGATSSNEATLTPTAEIKATPPVVNPSLVFGFEAAGLWKAGTGVKLSQSTTVTEGSASLAVVPAPTNGYTPITSVRLSDLPAVSPTLAVDLMLPTSQPNPWWLGALQVSLNCPSRNIYSQVLADVQLTGKKLNQWLTINMPVPNSSVAALLRAGYSDLTITIILNVQTGANGTYLFDNLRFVPVPANGCSGLPNGTACDDGNACTTGDTCQTNVCKSGTNTCPRPCGGIAGLKCEAKEFCAYRDDTCQIPDATGICTTIPQGCTTQYDPVCGCDGMDYSNACEAATHGTSVARHGKCDKTCGGIAGLKCEAKEFCAYRDDTCQIPDATGICTAIPTVCPLTDGTTAPISFDPVCGCDGMDYSNACEARMNGTSVARHGRCDLKCGGIAGFKCEDKEFCSYPEGTCHASDTFGDCTPIPTGFCPIPIVPAPVCGCDGRTYDGACEAAKAGASVDYQGACKIKCGGTTQNSCGEKEYCDTGIGLCGSMRPQPADGICQICTTDYKPVCGCNGKTYSNACEAAKVGIGIDYPGACKTICGGIAGVECGSGTFCDSGIGRCNVVDGGGTCQVCTTDYTPVCGCDSLTYPNACEAAKAKVGVSHTGACKCGLDPKCGDVIIL